MVANEIVPYLEVSNYFPHAIWDPLSKCSVELKLMNPGLDRTEDELLSITQDDLSSSFNEINIGIIITASLIYTRLTSQTSAS